MNLKVYSNNHLNLNLLFLLKFDLKSAFYVRIEI